MTTTGAPSPRRRKPYTVDSIGRALAHHEGTGAVFTVSPPVAPGALRTTVDANKWRVKLSEGEDPLVLSNGEAYALAVGLSAGERRWNLQVEP